MLNMRCLLLSSFFQTNPSFTFKGPCIRRQYYCTLKAHNLLRIKATVLLCVSVYSVMNPLASHSQKQSLTRGLVSWLQNWNVAVTQDPLSLVVELRVFVCLSKQELPYGLYLWTYVRMHGQVVSKGATMK